MKCYLFVLLISGVFVKAFSQERYYEIERRCVREFGSDSIIPYLVVGYFLCDAVVGDGVLPCLNFRKFEFYAANYPVDTIKMLTGKEYDPGLRIYSFWALLRRGYDSLEYISESFLTDTSRLSFLSGCLLDHYQVNEFIYELMAGHIDFDYKRFSKERLLAIRKKYSIKPVFKDDWEK